MAMAMAMLSATVLVAGWAGAATQGPEVALSATELVSDIRATQSVATDVESSLAQALATVKQQTDTLKEAGCEPGNSSSQCSDLKAGLRRDYLVVLDNVEVRLPALSQAVHKVVSNLETRMGKESGRTASDIQNELASSGAGKKPKRRPALQGISGSRLSESLGRLQSLVSATSSNGASFQTIQSDLYLDMRESLKIIDDLSAAIQSTRVLAELQLSEMRVGAPEQQIANEALLYLFGDTLDTTNALPGPPTAPGEPEYVDVPSPLEL